MQPSYKTGFYSPQRGGIAAYPQLWKGCVGAWSPGLGVTGSTLRDQSSYGNHGTLVGPTWDANSLNYNGTSDYTSLPGTILANVVKVATYSCWFYKTSAGYTAYESLIDIGGSNFDRQMSFFFGPSSTKLFCAVRDVAGEAVTVPTWTSNEWTHFAAVADVSELRLYRNGQQIASTTSTAILGTGNFTTYWPGSIGEYTTSGPNFQGYQSDHRIYDRALTPSEVALLARRPGIAYETARRVVGYSAAGGTALPVLYKDSFNAGMLSMSGGLR